MSRVVSNSTPLIYLAKIGRLSLLKALFGEVLVPKEVKREVVDRGKELGKKDAYCIEEAIDQGWIKVLDADPAEIPITLDRGEEEALSLAKFLKVNVVLIDDASARQAAKMIGLNPRGTLFVLLLALDRKILDFDEFLEALDQLIDQGFRLKEEVYIGAVKEATRLKGRNS